MKRTTVGAFLRAGVLVGTAACAAGPACGQAVGATTGGSTLVAPGAAAGGKAAAKAAAKQDAAGQDDILILVNVTADELRFDQVPTPTVEFPGNKPRTTVWMTDRQNLPERVEPGVTYRNIGIQLRIASRFEDIERIVAEALGEVPMSDAEKPGEAPVTDEAAVVKGPLTTAKSTAAKRQRR